MSTLQDGQESAAPPALAEEQRPRLILHIDLDRALYFRPLCGERGVEGWINRCLSETVRRRHEIGGAHEVALLSLNLARHVIEFSVTLSTSWLTGLSAGMGHS